MNKWVHLYIIKTIEKVIEKFDYSMVPAGFAHCFSGDCLKAGQCLRHQITRFIPDDRWSVSTMNPAQIRPGGNCPGFMTDQPLKYAYGMTHLLDNLLYVQAKAIKHQLLMYYGKAYFYCLKRKERCFFYQRTSNISATSFYGMAQRKNPFSIIIRITTSGTDIKPEIPIQLVRQFSLLR